MAKSILLREGQGTARYRLLDTIREFGLTKLRGRGNERALRRRHRAWYAALAARQEAFGPGRAEWIAALDADHENLRAALEFCLAEPGQAAAGAEMACDLWRYWETHGHLTEGRRILAALLDRLDHDLPRPGSGSCGPPGSSRSSRATSLPPGGCSRPACPRPARRAT